MSWLTILNELFCTHAVFNLDKPLVQSWQHGLFNSHCCLCTQYSPLCVVSTNNSTVIPVEMSMIKACSGTALRDGSWNSKLSRCQTISMNLCCPCFIHWFNPFYTGISCQLSQQSKRQTSFVWTIDKKGFQVWCRIFVTTFIQTYRPIPQKAKIQQQENLTQKGSPFKK